MSLQYSHLSIAASLVGPKVAVVGIPLQHKIMAAVTVCECRTYCSQPECCCFLSGTSTHLS